MTHKMTAALYAGGGLVAASLPLFLTGENSEVIGGLLFALAVGLEVMAVRTLIARFD